MDPKELKKIRQENLKKSIQDTLPGIAGVSSLLSIVPYISDQENAIGESVIDRAESFNKFFNKQVDPRLKNLYLKEGPYGLAYRSGNILSDIIPPTTTPFKPSDLSLAGKFAEQVEQLPPANFPGTAITVTPGVNPSRFSTPELTAAEIGPEGQKGYVWGNFQEPQYGYALGNLRRNRVVTDNPAIYFSELELDPAKQTRFKTTGDVVLDPSLVDERQWGQRTNRDLPSDVFFPKEYVRARGEVTAADLYTALKGEGVDVKPFINEGRPDEYLKTLAKQYAETKKQPVATALRELATPVPALGYSTREQGVLPTFKEFPIQEATAEQKARAGIGQIFREDVKSKWPVVVQNVEQNIGLPTELVDNPSTRAGASFRNVSPLRTGSTAAFALYSPEVFESLEKGKPIEAITKAGFSLGAGAMMDMAAKGAAVQAARQGVVLPARALAAVTPLATPVGVSLMLGGSTPINKKADQLAGQAQLQRAEAARRRGGRWKFPTPFGTVTVPELGISEAGGLFFR